MKILGAVLLMASAVQASDIRDAGGFFSRDAIERARQRLQKVEDDSGVETIIDTFAAAPGAVPAGEHDKNKFFQDWLLSESAACKAKGVYVLICKTPGRVQVDFHKAILANGYPRSGTGRIRDAALPSMRTKNYDAGLAAMCGVIESMKPTPRAAGVVPVAAALNQKADGLDWGWIALAAIGLVIIVALLAWSLSPPSTAYVDGRSVRRASGYTGGGGGGSTTIVNGGGNDGMLLGYMLGHNSSPSPSVEHHHHHDSTPAPHYDSSPSYDSSSSGFGSFDSGGGSDFSGGCGGDF